MTQLSNADKLAVVRTSLAHDRTLLAWVRTAIGIIGFGFTIYKFFQYFAQQEHHISQHHISGPRGFAILLILYGTLSLLFATLDYHRMEKKIRLIDPDLEKSRAPHAALFVFGFGVVTLIAVLLRI